jgi:spermidine/putrescine transport system substrate-binding protein
MKITTLTAVGLAAAFAVSSFAGGAQAAGELHLYNWANYFPPELMEKFEKETGVKVSLDTYASDEDMMAKLQAGGSGYDIVFPSGQIVEALIQQGLVEKIDSKSMSNFANVLPPFQSVAGDEKREYTVPYMWGTTGFTYDTAKVPGGELSESWKEFFEPKPELAGQIGALDSVADLYNAAAYYLGVDKCTEEPAEAQKILDLLLKQKEAVKVYATSGTIDAVVSGETILFQHWNGAAHRTKEQLPTAVYVYPEEGTSFWTDNMMVPKGSPNLENAKTFLNWMMKPENAAVATNYAGYMNSIKGSGEFLKDSLKADPAVNMPEKYESRLVPVKFCSAKALELREKVWTSLKK